MPRDIRCRLRTLEQSKDIIHYAQHMYLKNFASSSMPKIAYAGKGGHAPLDIAAHDVADSIQRIWNAGRKLFFPVILQLTKTPVLLEQITINLIFLSKLNIFFRIDQAFPIKVATLTRMLQNYRNKEYILDCFRYGFDLGYVGPACATYGQNRSTILNNLDIASSKMNRDILLNRIAGPFNSPPFDHFKISPLALRPKKEPNKYRLLHNFSAPYDETSVNLNIPESHSSVNYDSLSSALKIIQRIPHAFLAKSDIEDLSDSYHYTRHNFILQGLN